MESLGDASSWSHDDISNKLNEIVNKVALASTQKIVFKQTQIHNSDKRVNP